MLNQRLLNHWPAQCSVFAGAAPRWNHQQARVCFVLFVQICDKGCTAIQQQCQLLTEYASDSKLGIAKVPGFDSIKTPFLQTIGWIDENVEKG